MYNLPERVLKFLVNAVTDTLNTRANLLRWGKSVTNKCKHCSGTETLNHVLNNCSVFLDQGRYTWRHNNALKHLVKIAQKAIENSVVNEAIIAHDIPSLHGYTASSTIPLECTQTNLRPDLSVFFPNEKKYVYSS